MTRRPASTDPAPPSPRQLWQVAQRLADGDAPALAAAMSGVAYAVLVELIAAGDQGFAELCADCRRVHALDPDAAEARRHRLAQDAAERLLMDDNATVVVRFLRDDPAAKTGRRETALIQANQNLMRLLHTLTPEKLLEYQGLGRFVQPRQAANDAGPPGAAAAFSP